VRAVQYLRVSTERQAHNTSIPTQDERTAAYIEAQGWELAGTFTEPGESGENLDRPQLTAARAAARAGQFDVLVVYTLDRLTRDIDDLFLLRREFTSAGIATWAVHDGLDITTANTDDLLGVLFKGYFSHRERETIRRRMQEGIERTVLAGKWAGGRPPYGYRRDPESGRLAVYEPEAVVTRQMFAWLCDEKISSYAIAQRLDALEIPTSQGRAVGWTSGSVRHILKSETYTGRYTFGKRGERQPIVIDCPAIIDRPTFERAQAMLTRNRRYTVRPKHRYLLRGLIRCTCGAAFCGRTPTKGEKVYPARYVCLAREDFRSKRRAARCGSVTVPAAELEAAIWSDVEAFIRQPHLLAAELTRGRAGANDQAASEIAYTDRALADKRRELGRYLKLYGREGMPVEELEQVIAETRGHIVALEGYRQQSVERQRRADLWEVEIAGIVEALAVLREKLAQGLTWDDQRAFIEMLVKGIVIETRTDDAGERYPVARVTYSFERPQAEAPIPAELVPLFQDVAALTSTLNGAIISSFPTTE
jgi:site-specific DNA recombinase